MRNFGIPTVTTGRASGAQPLGRSHSRADTQRDNVIQFMGIPPRSRNLGSEVTPSFIDEADKDFGALCFALAAFGCPFALTGFAITVWLLLF